MWKKVYVLQEEEERGKVFLVFPPKLKGKKNESHTRHSRTLVQFQAKIATSNDQSHLICRNNM